MRPGVVRAHADRLPAGLAEHAVSLGEGDTPLLRLDKILAANEIDAEVWVKFEGANPTGSFKDRGMAVAVSAAKARGVDAVVCASTGNTSASAAAYAAAAGMNCVVLLPEGKVASGKLAQAHAHGAQCLVVKGSFDDAMRTVHDCAADGVEVVNSINPMRIQGQKTIAFEVIDALGRVPDLHALPVGNAGNITAHWIGYSEAAGMPTEACQHCGGACGFMDDKQGTGKRPRLLGVQAAGAAPFLAGAPVAQPETVATAIRIGNPQSWDQAHAAVRESGGKFLAVDDFDLELTQQQLAVLEGVFCEPAAAAGLAGVIAEAQAGNIPAGALVVCTLTGHGLKDPDVIKYGDVAELDADGAALRRALAD